MHISMEWNSMDTNSNIMRIECQHRNNGTCQLINQLVGVPTQVPEAACVKCSTSDNPQQLNRVVYGLAYFHETDVNRKRELIALIAPQAMAILDEGPGTELRKILDSIGVREPVDCDCKSYANLMDTWGADECNRKKQEIISHLNIQAITWLDMIKVALAGYLTTDALVTEAIRRADSNEPLKVKKYTITGRA